MAADSDKTTIEAKDGAEATAPVKKGKSKLLLFGGIGVGVIVIGVALALFVLKPMMAGNEEVSSEQTEEKADSKSGKRAESGKEAKKDTKEAAKPAGKGKSGESTMYTIEDVVVNPAGTAGQRFLSVSIGFEVESPQVAAELEKREALVRDALITILSSKTVAQLTDPRQKEIIRYQVRKRVSDLLKTDQLAGVYYTDFVLQ